MIRIKAFAAYPSQATYEYPLGHVDRNNIYVDSIYLGRNGDGGQISEEKARKILSEAIAAGALIVIQFADEGVEIELNKT